MDGEDTCMLLRDGANAPQHCAKRHSATVARAAAAEEADRHVIVRDWTDETALTRVQLLDWAQISVLVE